MACAAGGDGSSGSTTTWTNDAQWDQKQAGREKGKERRALVGAKQSKGSPVGHTPSKRRRRREETRAGKRGERGRAEQKEKRRRPVCEPNDVSITRQAVAAAAAATLAAGEEQKERTLLDVSFSGRGQWGGGQKKKKKKSRELGRENRRKAGQCAAPECECK